VAGASPAHVVPVRVLLDFGRLPAESSLGPEGAPAVRALTSVRENPPLGWMAS
jgi:hypothetical protein